MSSDDWDYEADLVLLRAKLRQASDKEKDDLRNLMQGILTLKENRGGSLPKNVAHASEHESLSAETDLNSSMAQKTVWLLNQFKKHFRNHDRDTRAANRSLDQNQTSNLNETGSGSQSNKEITWEDLELAWTTFEPFFKTFLSSKETNPFKIDEVIKNILQYLPLADLAKCRLINKTWNQNVIHVYYKNPKSVWYVEDLTKFDADAALAPNVPLSIFKRFKISLDQIKAEDCNTFFSTVGNQIKELEIRIGRSTVLVLITSSNYEQFFKMFQNWNHLH